MTPQQQHAYIEGFVKRAAEYGFDESEAIAILKQAAELKGDQHKLDVDKDGKIEGEDLKKLRQRKQAADGSAAPAAPAQKPIVGGTAAAAPTMNDRILRALGMETTGIPAAPAGAYGGVLGNAPAPVRKPAAMGGGVGVGGTTGTRAPK